jgi:hypothetical protein
MIKPDISEKENFGCSWRCSCSIIAGYFGINPGFVAAVVALAWLQHPFPCHYPWYFLTRK